jgi:membrane protein implicated in regulation of membrane protease activity
MTTADTLLFLGLLALAYWLEEARLLLMAGVAGIAAGLSAAALAPSPWVGIAVMSMGVYLVISAIRAMRAAKRSQVGQAASTKKELQ